MATTTATPSAPTTTPRAFPLMYFVIAFAFTWLFWWLAALGARDVIPALPGLTVIGTFGPLVAAVILTAQESGRAGLRPLLSRVVRWRVAPIWYAVAILGPLVITLAAMVVEVAVLGVQPPSLGVLIGELPSTVLTLLVNGVYMLIFVTLGEEVGWRGYALPALQARYSALLASLILGVVWALWHLPVFFNPDTSYSNLPFFLFLPFIVLMTVLITWLFNSTGGSVLMAMLFHAVINVADELWKVLPENSVAPAHAAEAAAANAHYYIMLTIVLGVAAIVLVLVYGATNLSRRPRQVLENASGESQPRVH
ncbi:MAG TPA: type II CAAX endopeptidase family protein [Chloroflexia bacterium]|nr:type II CAAX endopeptidase family protein [Chloroflexia bacterium]